MNKIYLIYYYFKDAQLEKAKTVELGKLSLAHVAEYAKEAVKTAKENAAQPVVGGTEPDYKAYADTLKEHVREDTVCINVTGNHEMKNKNYKEVFEKAADKKERIENAILKMEEEFRKGNNVDIPFLARECNISQTYFRRLFHHLYGASPKQYILSVRLRWAKTMLKSTDDSRDAKSPSSSLPECFFG